MSNPDENLDGCPSLEAALAAPRAAALVSTPEEMTTKELVQDDFISWFLVGAMTEYEREHPEVKLVSEIAGKKSVDLVLTMNGHQVPVRSMLKRMEKSLHSMVAKEAKKILEQKGREISNRLYELEQRIQRDIDATFPPEFPDDD